MNTLQQNKAKPFNIKDTGSPLLDVELALSIMSGECKYSLPPTIEERINNYIKAIDEYGEKTVRALIKRAEMVNKHINEFYSLLGTRLNPVKSHVLYVKGLNVARMRETATVTGEHSFYGLAVSKPAQDIIDRLMDAHGVDIADIIMSGLLEYLVPKLTVVMAKLPNGYGNIMLSSLGTPYLYIPLVQYLLFNGEALLAYELRNEVWGCKINPS